MSRDRETPLSRGLDNPSESTTQSYNSVCRIWGKYERGEQRGLRSDLRWRSQILYVGAELGVFDHLSSNCSKHAQTLTTELNADASLLYRLMRALASLGLLVESDARGFVTSKTGELFRSDHPESMRYRVLVAEGPEHYAIWKHLPDIIRDGKQDGFVREFGAPAVGLL
jgi:hypothetical protein